MLALIMCFSAIPFAFAEEAEEEVKKYTLTLDADGGSFGYSLGEKIETAFAEGEALGIDLTDIVPVKKGYVFAGWNQTIPEKMPANDLTIKALWNPKEAIPLVSIEYNLPSVGKPFDTEVNVMTPNVKVYVEGWFDDNDQVVKKGDVITDENGYLFAQIIIKADDGYCFNEDTAIIFNGHLGMAQDYFDMLWEDDVLYFHSIIRPVKVSDWPLMIFNLLTNDLLVNIMQKICVSRGKNVFPWLFSSVKDF